MTFSRVFLAGVAASAVMLAFDGDSFLTKFERLPEAVKNTANAHMDNAFPVSISSTQGSQGWNYQINTRLNGKYHDLVIDESGKLVAVKDETDLGSIPAAARESIQKQGAASKIVTLEKVTEGGEVSYAAVLRNEAAGTSGHIRVAADGTLQSNGSQSNGSQSNQSRSNQSKDAKTH